MSNAPPRLHGWPGTLGVLIILFAANVVLVDNDAAISGTSLAWSAVGFSTALLALAPVRRWMLLVPLTLIIPSGILWYDGIDPEIALRFGAIESSAALFAALILRRGRRSAPELAAPADVMWLFGAGVAAGLIGTAQPILEARSIGAADPKLLLAALMAHTTSVVIIVALGLTLSDGGSPRRTVETIVRTLLTGATLYLVFGISEGNPLTFLLVPLVGWAALRASRRMVAIELAAIGAIVGGVSVWGKGPFARLLPSDSEPIVIALVANGFMLSLCLLGLPLAAAAFQGSLVASRVRDNEALMHQLFLDAPIGTILMHSDETGLAVDEINDSARASLGLGPDWQVGGDLLDLIRPVAAQTHPNAWRRQKAGPVWRGMATANHRALSSLDVQLSAIHTAQGLTYAAQIIDLSDQHLALQRVEAAQQLTGATVDTARCIIMVVDARGRVIRLNASTRELTGYAEVDLLGKALWDTPLDPISRSDLEALFVWPNRSGEPVASERTMIGKTGERLRVTWICNVVAERGGPPQYAVVTGVDVTSERANAGLLTHLMQAGITTALIGVDNRGQVTVFNQGAALLLGFDPDDVLGKPFVELLDPVEVRTRTGAASPGEQFLSLVGSIDNEADSAPRDWTWINKDGLPVEVSMSLSITDDAVSDRVGILCVGQDVTRQREIQRTLAEALETERGAMRQLRELDRAKDEFVSTVSHELRTPTTSIVGYTELLLNNADQKATNQLPLLRAIERNGKRLVVICDDLLLLSGFQSESSRADVERVDLAAALDPAEESIRPLLADRLLEVTFTGPSEPLEIMGDAAQLDRVIINLVSNAIKFTEDGGRIEVDLGVHDGDAVLSVRDSGIGIPAAERDKVFQRFYRTTTAQQRAIQGTGLGLAIVTSIVDAHHGTIGLTSEVGVGTVVTVRLPLPPPMLSLVTSTDETG